MPNPVMVPVDGSVFAEQALPWAIAMARRMEAPVLLVRVRPSWPLDADGSTGETYMQRLQEQLAPEVPAGVLMELLADEFAPLDYPPPATNSVAEVLARTAKTRRAAVLVMATHGHGGVRRAWLGSVADALIRVAPCPVMLVRPEDEAFTIAADADRGIQHVLLPVDGTDESARAIPHAVAVGRLFGARYTLLRIISPLVWDVAPHSYDPYPVAASAMTGHAATDELEALASLAAPLRAQGLAVAVHVMDAPTPGPAILDYAANHGVDAIAIGTGGAGPLRRMLLGSVTDKVVRGARVPVLVCNTRRLAPRAVDPAPSAEPAATGPIDA